MNQIMAALVQIEKGRVLIGGVAATIIITMMMYGGASMMLGKPMDIAAELAQMIGVPWIFGMAIHVVLGIVAFSFAYVMIAPRFLPWNAAVSGLTWGFVLWLLAMLITSPMMGKGLFMGAMPVAVASLAGHLAYGLTLGLIVPIPRSDA